MHIEKTIFEKAMRYVVRRDCSERELRQKLAFAYPEHSGEIERALAQLKQLAYLDDQRFLEGRVRHRLQQGYGAVKIIAELEMHGLKKTDILTVLQAEEQDKNQMLHALILKKFSQVNWQDSQEKNKAIQALLRRGFLFEEIKAALDCANVQSPPAFPD